MQRVLRGAALVAAIGLLAAGCGGDSEESGGGSGDAAKPVTLKIGLIPIADVAPVFLGRRRASSTSRRSSSTRSSPPAAPRSRRP